eukprot:TRINITY_DN35947_c0_g1_i2.p1 TRINITY_DN35947_c0_g1~~TRINITY_DN35947_c0_g1_i2.p1  ORF type:complete len:473 (-),score=40.98 TRINITY_DN35947_c0_g1_i2:268-1686(-)
MSVVAIKGQLQKDRENESVQQIGECQKCGYSLKEIALHNMPHDCWLIVDRKVYDVTKWVAHHPGGSLIHVSAGQDCTQMFISYHPKYVKGLLEQYYIGDVQDDEQIISFHSKDGGSKFYDILKSRAEKYFRDNKLDPQSSLSVYIKSIIIMLSILVSQYGAFYVDFQNPVIKYICAMILGAFFAEVGVSIMHDANHGAYSSNQLIRFVASITLDMIGASSFMWRQQHVVGHHQHTNVHERDPDVNHPLMRRATPQQPQMKHHRFQHIYCMMLYSLLAVKSVWIDDFVSYASGKISAVRVQQMTVLEGIVFWSGKVFFFMWFVMLPFAWSQHSVVTLLSLQLLAHAVTGYMLSFMFQVAHVVSEVDFFDVDDKNQVACDWAESQLLSTADFAPRSFFWTHVSGGLNHQVVHHLFPGVNHAHYPDLSKIVAETAKEFGLKYIVYPTFWEAVKAHVKHLQRMGAPLSIPSLHTVG